MTKEEIYDAEIAPLMTRIIATAKSAGIAMVASFELDGVVDSEEGVRLASTVIVPEVACRLMNDLAAAVNESLKAEVHAFMLHQ